MISANVIRRFHCYGPPDEILNVEAIYTVCWIVAKRELGLLGMLLFVGRLAFFIPPKKVRLA